MPAKRPFSRARVINCTFEGQSKAGVLSHANDLTITNSTFTNTGEAGVIHAGSVPVATDADPPAPIEPWWKRHSRELAVTVVGGLVVAALVTALGWSG